MHLPRVLTGVWFVVLAGGAAAEEPRAALPRRTAAATPTLLEAVAPEYRSAVSDVVKSPTLSVKAVDDSFTTHARLYEWMLEHPDRVSQAWLRLNVQCVEITDLRDGRFRWADETGSELTWRNVGRFSDGVVWYATGKVKPGALLPLVPVKAVAVLQFPKSAADAKPGTVSLAPTLNVYTHTDSKTAAALLRMAGPAGPRMAEQGAEQLLLFFSGPARHLYKHPDQIETLLAPKAK